jgi:hypothetical protein
MGRSRRMPAPQKICKASLATSPPGCP